VLKNMNLLLQILIFEREFSETQLLLTAASKDHRLCILVDPLH
jgi:hypothetical protein